MALRGVEKYFKKLRSLLYCVIILNDCFYIKAISLLFDTALGDLMSEMSGFAKY